MNDVDHKIDDIVYFYHSNHEGERSQGKVIDIYCHSWVEGYPMKHYIIEIETHIDPYLVIRSDFCVWDKP